MVNYRELIISQIKNELNPDEECLRRIAKRLNKADSYELEKNLQGICTLWC